MMNKYLRKAEKLKPVLNSQIISSKEKSSELKQGDTYTYDFGNHYTGYVKIRFSSKGSHQDAPVLLKLKFCEVKRELDEDTQNYNGWISKSWIQEEIVHIDDLSKILELPRRYSFRYLKVEVLGMSSKHSLYIEEIDLKAVTSAYLKAVQYSGSSDLEKKIDKVALRTLSECMQYEFEDGPKRDRRLWLGDLRLEALTNYETYKNYELVKRCIYLFAGTADENGRLSACVFTSPEIEADDTYMFDYSLFFISILWDYYEATNDKKLLKELYDLAETQLKLASEKFDENALIKDSNQLGWCFLDWSLELNKQGGAQAVYIYSAKRLLKIAKTIGRDTLWIQQEIEQKSSAALKQLFDEQKNLFVSGSEKQISYATNVWFCLAEILDEEKSKEILNNLENCTEAIKPVTPYMYHHYIQALINANEKSKAKELLCRYWGGMIENGADTFYELYNPENPDESPYGAAVVNSYCHAWSCTPSYFLRKYFDEDRK